jgi:chemotaxis protein histidine kinase CheA
MNMSRQHPIELFMPPNMLRAKAGGGFGGVDLGAIKRGETAMENLKGEFAGMAGDTVAALAAAHRAYVEKASPDDRAALLRAAHDIKGLAGTLQYPLMGRVAASLSHLLLEAPEGKLLPAKLVEAHVRAMQIIHRQTITDSGDKVALALLAELENQVGDILTR